MTKTQSRANGAAPGFLLFLLFLGLKLAGVIAWSWLWVLSPIWIPFALVGVIATMAALVALATKR